MRARGPIGLLLAGAVLAVYAQVGWHEFVAYDDPVYILNNPNLRAGFTPEGVAAAFTRFYEANWIPLTWLSLQLDYALYGTRPAGYLLTNVALHTASALLLLAALHRMTGALGRSAFVAAVFALHPLHVESVAWASERKDALSGLFWMLAMLAHARYAERPSAGRYLAVAGSLALGLLAKPMLVTLPLALLLLDYWPLRRLRRGARGPWLEKLPLLALAAAASVMALLAQTAGGATSSERLPAAVRLMNALESYVWYLAKSVWPSGLAAFYPHPFEAVSTWAAAGALALLAALTAAALRAAPARPHLAVGWLWYLGTLVPVIGLLQVGLQARADRYTYVPLVGLAIAVAWEAEDVAARLRRGRRALPAVALAALAALAAAAFLQVRHWRDSDALLDRALAVTEGNFIAHAGLADLLLERGRLDEARHHYQQALHHYPEFGPAKLGLADVLLREGAAEQAITRYRGWARAHPDHARVHASLAFALAGVGRLEEARAQFERALRLDPHSAELHAGLAAAAEALGRPDEAVRHYRRALRLRPELGGVANNLAWILATSEDAALRDPQEAIRLAGAALGGAAAPEPAYLDTLGAAHAAAGNFPEALRAAGRALEIATRRGDRELARAIEGHLALYRAGRALAPAADGP